MNLAARIAGVRPAPEVRAAGHEDTLWLREAFVGARTTSGELVTVEEALHLDPVVAAVRLLSDSLGALPLKVFQRMRGGAGRMEAWMEPAYRLLHDEPNPEMGAMDLWSLVMTHLQCWGNAYLAKQYAPGGVRIVRALWPLHPAAVKVGRSGGLKRFEYREPETGRVYEYTAADVIHVRGLSLDGLIGLSPIALARTAIGRGLAADAFAGGFFRHSAIPRGVVKVEKTLSDDAAERLSERWHALYGGRNQGRVAVLEEGTTFEPITMPLEDAQFVEQEKLGVQKIARIFGVPAAMIGGERGDSLTYSTVEGDAINFERYSLRPWMTRLEQALARDRDLFPGDSRSLYPEFIADALLRADTKTRYESYAIGLDPVKGWMRRDEVRALENLPAETDDGVPA